MKIQVLLQPEGLGHEILDHFVSQHYKHIYIAECSCGSMVSVKFDVLPEETPPGKDYPQVELSSALMVTDCPELRRFIDAECEYFIREYLWERREDPR